MRPVLANKPLRRCATTPHAIAAFAALLLRPASALAQCAMCGTALQGSEDPLTRGMLWSVAVLISLPYTIVAVFVVGIFWTSRRAKAARAAGFRPGGPPYLRLVTRHLVTQKEEIKP